jgi:hypothetical protein
MVDYRHDGYFLDWVENGGFIDLQLVKGENREMVTCEEVQKRMEQKACEFRRSNSADEAKRRFKVACKIRAAKMWEMSRGVSENLGKLSERLAKKV